MHPTYGYEIYSSIENTLFFLGYNHAGVHVDYFQRTFFFFFLFFWKYEIWTSIQRWSNFKIALFIYSIFITCLCLV